MAINKVVYGDDVLMDLTGDTIQASALYTGMTAHDATGAQIIGTMRQPNSEMNRGYVTNDTDMTTFLGNYYSRNTSISFGGDTYTQCLGGYIEVNTPIALVPGSQLYFADTNIPYIYRDSVYDPLSAFTPTRDEQVILDTSDRAVVISGAVIKIAGDENLVPENIISGKSIFGVNGNVVTHTIRTGTQEPSDSLGADGDLYLILEG